MENKPKDTLDIGKAGPLLKEVYNTKLEKTKQKDKKKFSKIRNMIKKYKQKNQ